MSETATSEYEAVKAWWNALTPVERLDAMEPLGSGATTQQAYRYHLLAASHARLLAHCKELADIAMYGHIVPWDCEAIARDIKAAEALGESP